MYNISDYLPVVGVFLIPCSLHQVCMYVYIYIMINKWLLGYPASNQNLTAKGEQTHVFFSDQAGNLNRVKIVDLLFFVWKMKPNNP